MVAGGLAVLQAGQIELSMEPTSEKGGREGLVNWRCEPVTGLPCHSCRMEHPKHNLCYRVPPCSALGMVAVAVLFGQQFDGCG